MTSAHAGIGVSPPAMATRHAAHDHARMERPLDDRNATGANSCALSTIASENSLRAWPQW